MCLCFLSLAMTWARPLTERAKVSLLTSSPYEAEVFTVYGHAALRINDPGQRIDIVFNYGLFNFNKPFFIYRFASGETDYMLGAINYSDYIVEYQMRGSTVTEQILNLTAEEKEAIWLALQENYKPENREYRYNFFFDNCATRPVALIEKNVAGNVDYSGWKADSLSFRDMINDCTRNKPWLTFGCDLALGSPTDRMATKHEMMFLPMLLKDAFEKAEIVGEDGTKRKLVEETIVLPAEPDEAENTVVTPLVAAILLLVFFVALSLLEVRTNRYFAVVDGLLFFVAGIGGCILFFLCFVSEHPCTCPNWNLIWIQPLHLLSPILYVVKKWRKVFYYYHFINFVAILLFVLCCSFIPQHFNMAVIPLAFSLLLRSGMALYRAKSENRTLANR